MSKTKKRLKLSRKYRVAYETPEGGSKERWGFVDALPKEATLAAITKNCREFGIDAFISDDTGEYRGYVSADGAYRLTRVETQ
ncbi:hypothetical protein D7Y23_02390 [Corallococcus sp. AB050B]|nr:hypothetical protein D7Y23_02390 [Corallococcus sp. AB050B]